MRRLRSVEADLRRAEDATADALYLADIRQQLLDSARNEVERCRRNHADLAQRNGQLQATNVQLAHRAEQAEHKLAAAVEQYEHMSMLAAAYWRQLTDLGIKPRELFPEAVSEPEL